MPPVHLSGLDGNCTLKYCASLCVFDVKWKEALYFFREVSFTLFFLSWAIYHRRDKIGRSALHDGSPLARSALVTSLFLLLYPFSLSLRRSLDRPPPKDKIAFMIPACEKGSNLS